MYHLPLGYFPAQEQYNLPSLPCPWAGRISGNRPFNRTPSTKGTVGLHARDYTGTCGKSQFRSVLFFWINLPRHHAHCRGVVFCAFPALKQGSVALFQKRKGAGWYPISPEIDTPQNRDRYPIRRRYTSKGQQAGQDLPRCGDMAPHEVLTSNRTYVIIQLQSNIVEAWNTAGRYGCASVQNGHLPNRNGERRALRMLVRVSVTTTTNCNEDAAPPQGGFATAHIYIFDSSRYINRTQTNSACCLCTCFCFSLHLSYIFQRKGGA